jgi:hypothetical protein
MTLASCSGRRHRHTIDRDFRTHQPLALGPAQSARATIEAATPPSCRPCHKPTCRLEHHLCMRDIPPQQVLDAVQSALAHLQPLGGNGGLRAPAPRYQLIELESRNDRSA